MSRSRTIAVTSSGTPAASASAASTSSGRPDPSSGWMRVVSRSAGESASGSRTRSAISGRRSYVRVVPPFCRSRGSRSAAMRRWTAAASRGSSAVPSVMRYTAPVIRPGSAGAPSQTFSRSTSRWPAGRTGASPSRTRHADRRSVSHSSISSARPSIPVGSGAPNESRGRTASMVAIGRPDWRSASSHDVA